MPWGLLCRGQTLLTTPKRIAKFFCKNRNPLFIQNPCVFQVRKGCTRFCIQGTPRGNESVPWDWMMIHAEAFTSSGVGGHGHPATNVTCRLQAWAGDSSWRCCCQLCSVCRRTSLCHISRNFFFPFLQKDASSSWISLQECCGPWPAVPAD